MADFIVNTSPLQYLHQLGRLSLLPALFSRIITTQAVASEIAAGKSIGVALPDLTRLDWLDLHNPSASGALINWDLGAGEIATLSLALERPGSTVILDDSLARRAALALNIPLIGTLGILLKAKQAGYLELVGPELDKLDSLDFRVTTPTRNTVLQLAGEA